MGYDLGCAGVQVERALSELNLTPVARLRLERILRERARTWVKHVYQMDLQSRGLSSSVVDRQ